MMITQLRVVLVMAAACASAFGDTVVVPNLNASTPGNMPIRIGGKAQRIQEVLGSGQFQQFTGAVMITGIRVRSAVGAGPVSVNWPSFKITLSTTSAFPNTGNGHTLPSVTYANNVGPDATVVYNAALTASSPGCSGPAPCPFDMAIPLTTPFSYDLNKGRLLVDLVLAAPSGTQTGSLDGVVFSDTISSTVVIVLGDPTQDTGTLGVGGIVFEIDTAPTTQGPSVSAVVNAFSVGPELSPGSLASIFGSNLGSSASPPTVMIGGKSVPVTFASPGQLAVQIPFEAATGATTLTVSVNGATSAAFNLTLASYAPAINAIGGAGNGTAVVQTAKGVLVTSIAPASSGDTLVTFATGLGPTSPGTPTGQAKATAQTAVVPTLTIGGIRATVIFAGVASGFQGGLYQINFTVPAGLQGSQPMVLTIGGISSTNKVALPLFGITSIVNNAQAPLGTAGPSAGTAAAGSFVTVFANGLGSTDQLTGFPATKFQGVQVTFNGIAAPLFHLITSPPAGASQTAQASFQQQIDLLVPNELPVSGTVNVQLTTPGVLNPNYSLKMAPAVPGLYRVADPSVKTRLNVIAQFNTTVWLAMPASMATSFNLPGNCSNSNISPLSLCGQPATIGDYLLLYATGLGITTPNGDPNGRPLPTGVPPPLDGSVLYETPTKPAVTVGGVPVNVLYSGLPPGITGEYQIVFQVPSGVTSGDDIPVVVTMGGLSDSATISIQPR